MLYSVIIPCYKSARTIRKVVNLTRDEMNKYGRKELEFILVNDCSPDDNETINTLIAMNKEFNDVIVLDLAKNSGQHNAVMAGLNYAKGEYIIARDDDMQTHPSQIDSLLREIDKGYDIVYGYYPKKKHNLFRNFGSYVNYLTVRFLIGKPKELKTSSFWVIRKYIKDSVIQYKGKYVYLQGLFLRTTRNISSIPIKHFEREVGKSNYTLKKLVGLWLNILGFSIVPLRVATIIGYLFSIVGIIGALVIIISKCVHPSMAVGWPSIMVAICFFSGVHLSFLGLIGEYIGRMYMGINKEPQYVIKRIYRSE